MTTIERRVVNLEQRFGSPVIRDAKEASTPDLCLYLLDGLARDWPALDGEQWAFLPDVCEQLGITREDYVRQLLQDMGNPHRVARFRHVFPAALFPVSHGDA